MTTINYFANEARIPLLTGPTPLHKAETLSRELGIELWLKRDDLTGPSAFGGNKMRKLEFLLGMAKAKGLEYIFTFGATQSNHAMETAAACCRCGLKPVLYLVAVVEPDPKSLRGNMLLDTILGAEVHVVRMLPGETEEEADARALEMARRQIAGLEAQGHGCMEIPIGGSNWIGSMGFASGYLEMRDQIESLEIPPFEYIFHSTGSAGTLAGLMAGRALAAGQEKIVSVGCSPKGPDYEDKAAAIANQVLERIQEDVRVSREDVTVAREYYGEGYEIPSRESTAALKLLARKEGIFLDPVYTAKAFAGLLDWVKTGKIRPGQRVLFWHTGGSASLFAEPAIVGDFSDEERKE
ncbi:MAG: D-cysteine desulfhydrase family protein [Peptococcaceae bacterium]|nr:D-cysteine desulfhydrase family protein [Peptococcaceae bacterium]